MSQRDYNHVYIWGRLCVQVMQDSQHDGIVIGLTPEITLAINNGRSIVALGLDWLFGTINIAIMSKSFQRGEKQRRESIRAQAQKLGISERQYELRWGW